MPDVGGLHDNVAPLLASPFTLSSEKPFKVFVEANRQVDFMCYMKHINGLFVTAASAPISYGYAHRTRRCSDQLAAL
jgi:hypothetical protein